MRFTVKSTVFKTNLLALGLCAALLAACGDESSTAGTGKTLATVNGEAIKESKISDQLTNVPPQLLEGREADVRRQLLEQQIDQKLVMQEAMQRNLDDSEAYQQQMESFRRQVLAQLLVQNELERAVTEEVMRDLYERTKAARSYPAVRASHILVSNREEAEAILAIANPQNFAELARERSQDPAAQNGGDLGWFSRQAMVPEFAEVAFNTPAGTLASAPVKTQFGWHVVYVAERNNSYTPTYEEVAPALRNELSQTVLRDFLANLRQQASITYADGMAPETAAAPAAAEASPTAAPAAAH